MAIDVNIVANDWTIASVVASFIIALIALILGISSTRQIRGIRKDEKREHNLRDIIKWAIRILQVNRGPNIVDTPIPKMNKKTMSFSSEYATLLMTSVNIIDWEGVYIEYAAKNINDKSLIRAVEMARLRIRQHCKAMDLDRDNKMKDGAAIGRHRKKLDDTAKKVIELATELL